MEVAFQKNNNWKIAPHSSRQSSHSSRLHPSVHVGVKLTNWYGMTCLNLIDHHTSYNNHLLGLKKFVKQHGTFCNTVILEKKVFIISKSSNKLICYMRTTQDKILSSCKFNYCNYDWWIFHHSETTISTLEGLIRL